ncbi:molecular chaperone DnaJ [Candidatus Azambacteria bacterium]|nr:molecular chaperone DnaJ [Candidatus Azambacteria bacterium]
MAKDYYAILGVARGASEDEIKKAYRKLAHTHHPDKKGGTEAKFKEINEAYQVLSDKMKRQQYDMYGRVFEGGQGAGAPGGGFGGFQWDAAGGFEGENFSDIFEDFFGFGRQGARASAKSARGEDIQVTLGVDLEDVAFGKEKEIRLKRHVACAQCSGSGAEPKSEIISCETCGGTGQVHTQHRTVFGVIAQTGVCAHCHGRGKTPKHKCAHCHGAGIRQESDAFTVKIPAGIDSREAFRVAGKGEEAPYGGKAGDLYVIVSVASHSEFSRQGSDLYKNSRVSFSQAALGGKQEVSTLWGAITLSIPQGVQSGTVIRVPGKGMPKKSGYGKGDLFVSVFVETPAKLSHRQKELLDELKKEGL